MPTSPLTSSTSASGILALLANIQETILSEQTAAADLTNELQAHSAQIWSAVHGPTLQDYDFVTVGPQGVPSNSIFSNVAIFAFSSFPASTAVSLDEVLNCLSLVYVNYVGGTRVASNISLNINSDAGTIYIPAVIAQTPSL